MMRFALRAGSVAVGVVESCMRRLLSSGLNPTGSADAFNLSGEPMRHQ